MSDPAHIESLAQAIAEEEENGGNPWLARAFYERALRDIEESNPPTVRDQIATVLTSGLSGAVLFAELLRRFPACRRQDAFAAAAMAVTVWQSEVTIAGLNRLVDLTENREAA
jgi:hypothetical protein